jgi:hypothetical protein
LLSRSRRGNDIHPDQDIPQLPAFFETMDQFMDGDFEFFAAVMPVSFRRGGYEVPSPQRDGQGR